ncbi:uncharacterized protein LOC143357663 [Halictus rubicundus]|uniref:uncharacterized protein LOC143357663 n=1 Tax=Halictus rubicundus TaxID=77578 RepID=UPI0040365926
MELSNNQTINNPSALNKDFLQISCNWKIANNKQFHDVFTMTASDPELENVDVDEIVNLYTCISLEPTQSSNEPCMLEIKLPNHQKISHIAIVSEAYVLEFFKQFGEYKTTVFGELLDDFDHNYVYLAKTTFHPPTSEASVKFTKTNTKGSVMWIYGIMLYMTESITKSDTSPPSIFNPEMIKQFLTKLSFNDEVNASVGIQSCYKNILNSSVSTNVTESHENEVGQYNKDHTESNMNINAYIDNKLHDMETRLMKRIDEMEQKTNEKLDNILKQLETQLSK